MGEAKIRFYEFGEFRLDSRRRVLTKGEAEVPISARNYDLLFALVTNEGRTLSHDELLETVWEGAFVEQSNLKKGISALRQILGEDPNSARFIRTIPRRGYSFIAPVRQIGDGAATVSYVATEVVLEEEVFEDETDPKHLSAVSRRSYSRPVSVGLLIAAILSLGAFAAYTLRDRGQKTFSFAADRVRIARVTNDGNCWDASISADGNFIVCAVAGRDGWSLVAKQVSVSSEIRLTPPEKGIVFWSFRVAPDGNSVYYVLHDMKDPARDGLYQVPFLGGTPRKIADRASGHITISPDAKRLGYIRIVGNTSYVVVSDINGQNESVIGEYGDGYRVWGLNFGPEGKSLLCSARFQSDEKLTGFVEEIALAGGQRSTVVPPQKDVVLNAAWTPDRSSVIVAMRDSNSHNSQIWRFSVADGEMRRVTNDLNSYRLPFINLAGTVISTSQERAATTLHIRDERAGTQYSLGGDQNGYSNASWTPDGRIVFTSFEDGSDAVWIINADGSGKRRITDGRDGVELSPRVSGDGRSIVFSSRRSGTKSLWKIGIDGLGLTQLTPNSADAVWEGELLRDNETLIGETQGKDGNHLWIRRPGAEPARIAESDLTVWDLSPDEKLIAYEASGAEGKREIVVISVGTGEVLKRFGADPGYILRWTDDATFVYDRQIDGRAEVLSQSLDAQWPRLIFELPLELNETLYSFALERSTGRIASTRGRLMVDAVTIRAEESR